MARRYDLHNDRQRAELYAQQQHVVLATSYDALAAERDRLRAMLGEVEAWLEDREDVVDGDYGEPAPNAEMRLLREVRAALSGGRHE